MNEPALKRGIFLSADGLNHVHQIYDAFREKAAATLTDAIKDSRTWLLEDKWTSFDHLYVSLYATNLLRNEEKRDGAQVRRLISPVPDAFRRSNAIEGGFSRHGILKILVNAQLPTGTSETEFDQTLIDEFVVSDLQQLRGTVEQILPFKMIVECFAPGGIGIEFGIYAKDLSPLDTMHFIDATDGGDGRHNPWPDFRSRFHIKTLQLETSA
jgi:hypothetical protein